MAYDTTHNLTVSGDPHGTERDYHEKLISRAAGYSKAFKGSKAWYNMAEHMTTHSKSYPGLMFTVEGYGEEAGDIWRHYFRNGKSKRVDAVITFPDPPADFK